MDQLESAQAHCARPAELPGNDFSPPHIGKKQSHDPAPATNKHQMMDFIDDRSVLGPGRLFMKEVMQPADVQVPSCRRLELFDNTVPLRTDVERNCQVFKRRCDERLQRDTGYNPTE